MASNRPPGLTIRNEDYKLLHCGNSLRQFIQTSVEYGFLEYVEGPAGDEEALGWELEYADDKPYLTHETDSKWTSTVLKSGLYVEAATAAEWASDEKGYFLKLCDFLYRHVDIVAHLPMPLFPTSVVMKVS